VSSKPLYPPDNPSNSLTRGSPVAHRKEPTIGDQRRALVLELRALGDSIDLGVYINVDAYVTAFQERRAELLEDLAAIRTRDLTAQMVRVRAATVAELEVCERALDRAGAAYEADEC
jgi:hypothetical protein